MKNLNATICLTIAVLLESSGVSCALPECPGNYNANTWTNCFGTYTLVNGNKYVGKWKNGIINGQGSMTYVSGTKYVGEFKDDKRHGPGTLTFADGRIVKGIWKDGRVGLK